MSDAAFEPVRVTPLVFNLLKHARDLSIQCNGAFDITIAPLVKCWGFMGANGRMPSPEEIAQAQKIVAAFDLPENRTKGVIPLDGRMVERMHAEMGQRVLAIASAIAQRGSAG